MLGVQVHNQIQKWTKQHISVEHVVDESFIYPDSSKETDCPVCDEIFLEDHNFARHIYEKHFFFIFLTATTAKGTFLENMT